METFGQASASGDLLIARVTDCPTCGENNAGSDGNQQIPLRKRCSGPGCEGSEDNRQRRSVNLCTCNSGNQHVLDELGRLRCGLYGVGFRLLHSDLLRGLPEPSSASGWSGSPSGLPPARRQLLPRGHSRRRRLYRCKDAAAFCGVCKASRA